jgi:beta-glucanase (GH16 family)
MTRTQQGNKQPWSDGFHTVAVDWAADSIAFSVDGKVRATLYPRSKDPTYGWWTEASGAPPNAPFNEPFYMILNLAVGGLWPGVPDDTTPFPATLAVDHVRVWGTPV